MKAFKDKFFSIQLSEMNGTLRVNPPGELRKLSTKIKSLNTTDIPCKTLSVFDLDTF